jgi:hypothetical protein
MKAKRPLLVALAVLLAYLAIAAVSAPPADAVPAYGIHDFYSASTFTTWVGVLIVNCDGSTTQLRTATPFVQHTPFDCRGGGDQ